MVAITFGGCLRLDWSESCSSSSRSSRCECVECWNGEAMCMR
jgi:hypothetical protein